jgi:NADH-quinone oxidoreductase subunit J
MMSEMVGPIERVAQWAFYVIATTTLVGAWWAVAAKNLFRAALGLAVALFGVAVLYLFLEAEFLTVVQLLIYVGAILTLILFGVMLTARMSDPSVPRWNRQVGLGGLLVGMSGVGLGGWVFFAPWTELRGPSSSAPLASVADLGRLLVGKYLLPFELLSVVLLGALVGAIYVAKRTGR